MPCAAETVRLALAAIDLDQSEASLCGGTIIAYPDASHHTQGCNEGQRHHDVQSDVRVGD